MRLSDPITPGVLKTTQTFCSDLAVAGIRTLLDLLLFFPRLHEDLSAVSSLADAPQGEKVTLRGTVTKLKLVRTRSKKTLVQGIFLDDEGSAADVVWFNQPHIMRMLKDGQAVSLVGKVIEDGYKLKIQSPTFEDASRPQALHAGRIVAVYPQVGRITSRWIREKMALLEPLIGELPETLPASVLLEEKLLHRAQAIHELHRPTTPEALADAKKRMEFEEIFLLQKEALERKQAWQKDRQERLKIPMDTSLIRSLFASLNFVPTGGQKVAIYEILKDMEKDVPMSRLLEGDVGSGKTLVAVAVMANVLRHRGQCALMVPTEVLARQHIMTITRLLTTLHSYLQSSPDAPSELKNFRLPTVALLTGAMSLSEAKEVRVKAHAGLIDIVIGTHALIEDSTVFHDLKLVIIDEQHRFGVEQRRALTEKGSPHVLSMTATPIPRTLALTAYGDHDLSVLLEKPGQRRKIHTKVVAPEQRMSIERFMEGEFEKGRQAYVICPLIQTSNVDEFAEIRNVETEFGRLRKVFPRRTVVMLHGKMTPEEKARVMADFKDQRSHLLVSTSVIEVGIDVPNSTMILIEGAERFGLAQLHQFRGRVGRGEHQSYCFLCTTNPEQARSERLKAMEEYDSGFELAEIDLRLRGPGEIFGLRQSGVPALSFASLTDIELLLRARRAAERFLGIERPQKVAI